MNSQSVSAQTVLVVDDQETLTRLMRKTLENSGFRVLRANSGHDAIAAYRNAKPPVDLLVTDCSMPGMTGVELARDLCRQNPELSVLYISGSWPGNDLLAELDPGRCSFLAKPFRQSELLRSAKGLLHVEPVDAPSWGSREAGLKRLSLER